MTTPHETPTICACGHPPTPQGPDSCTTGVAWTQGNVPLCFDCADLAQREDMKRADAWSGYLASDGQTITTWSGGKLASVTMLHKFKLGGACRGTAYTIHAIDTYGGRWHGRSPGPGMYCKLRRLKGAK